MGAFLSLQFVWKFMFLYCLDSCVYGGVWGPSAVATPMGDALRGSEASEIFIYLLTDWLIFFPYSEAECLNDTVHCRKVCECRTSDWYNTFPRRAPFVQRKSQQTSLALALSMCWWMNLGRWHQRCWVTPKWRPCWTSSQEWLTSSTSLTSTQDQSSLSM